MMINSIIIDDVPLAIQNLEKKLSKINMDVHILGTAQTRKEGIRIILNHLNHLDLLFLDIELDEGDGFSLLEEVYRCAEEKNLAHNFEVIFVTGHEEHALEAIRHNSLYFVTKAIQEEELVKSSPVI